MMEKIKGQVAEIQDSGEELELDGRQADRNDEVYGAVFEMCRTLSENPDLEWDMAFIGEIADCAASVLARHGIRVRFPSVVTNPDGSQYIAEYYGED